jgi:hypothetical protein
MERQLQQRTFSKRPQPKEEKGKEAEVIAKILFQALTDKEP